MQLLAPAHERVAIRRGRERRDHRADEDRLRGGHPRVRRHLERAQLDDALPAERRVRVEQLVDRDLRAVRRAGDIDEQVAQQAVDLPRRRRRLVEQPRQRDLELVERVVARLVDARRLRRRSDEHAGHRIRQRGVMLRERDEAREQLGPHAATVTSPRSVHRS